MKLILVSGMNCLPGIGILRRYAHGGETYQDAALEPERRPLVARK
tara:strand:- start:566 stop:700 length:135 start_codon:yes stop_codon:yes gene_type:complete